MNSKARARKVPPNIGAAPDQNAQLKVLKAGKIARAVRREEAKRRPLGHPGSVTLHFSNG